MRYQLLALLGLFLLLAPNVSAEPSKKPISPKWELVARSDFIAKAKINVPLGALKASLEAKDYDYINLQVDIEEILKGSWNQRPQSIRYYTEPAENSPSASFLEKYNDRDVLIFLVRVDRPEVSGYYFASSTPAAVSPFDSDEFSAIAGEVEQQQGIDEQFDELAGQTTSADAKIQDLLRGLTRESTQEAAWQHLLSLSRNDAPSIIRAMNDQRPLGRPYVCLPSSPGSSEATTTYSPPRVIEAASIVLSHLAQMDSFRAIYNGGTAREESADVCGWRVWCAYNF